MTILIGSDYSSANTVGFGGSGHACIGFTSVVAAASGTLDTLWAHHLAGTTSTQIRIAIWNSAGTTMLGQTATLTASNADVIVSGAVSPGVAVVSGTTYRLAIYGDNVYISLSADVIGAASQGDDTQAPGSFPTWPASLTTSGSSAGPPAIWGSQEAAGGSQGESLRSATVMSMSVGVRR